jgi:DNA-binding response OmpR family regulator
LAVIDAPCLVDLAPGYPQAAGCLLRAATDELCALERTSREDPALVVLDRMQPGIDAIQVSRGLRRCSNALALTPSRQSQEVDKPVGLSVGADDGLARLCNPGALTGPANALLRRAERRRGSSAGGMPAATRPGNLVIDGARRAARAARAYAPHAAGICHPGRLLRVSGPGVYRRRAVGPHPA